MKRLIFLFALICCGWIAAQSADQKKILEDSQAFMSMFQKKDYQGMLDMTHPAIFEKIDKKTMIDGFKRLLEGNDEFTIEIIDADKEMFSVSDIFTTADNIKYAFSAYPMKMKMSFLNEAIDDEKKKMMLGLMEAQGMKARFLNDTTMEMSKQSMILALNDKSTGNTWKYLNYDEANPLYISIVPVEVMKKAKEYYVNLLIKQKGNAN
ncbi:hypothetical protein C1637_00600 [Chryseobacterium lactis]|uniref:Uncharacterized protein n=1 Tax=Chryseobacterium lactis TaxID=1241981 RepID=A0A3G6RW79_CHRLC|nr:hypothetical protein [Chryseobacterium lactis]AZA81115.1 hypothetical protein EG342_03985 [Chryseobacterium lactis]AZB06116.1 hypothetical protein EG341_20110 [Chryseobacterium lactis]PNW14966.1 hypothetical protein C1637_00600 [Chryseobacterium lactis]